MTVEMLNALEGFEISFHDKSKRIIDVKIKDEIIDKLIFPFNKFDLTALELKPFTRFTLAKSLDDLTNNKLSELMNSIIRDRSTGCFIIGPKNITAKIPVAAKEAITPLIILFSRCFLPVLMIKVYRIPTTRTPSRTSLNIIKNSLIFFPLFEIQSQ